MGRSQVGKNLRKEGVEKPLEQTHLDTRPEQLPVKVVRRQPSLDHSSEAPEGGLGIFHHHEQKRGKQPHTLNVAHTRRSLRICHKDLPEPPLPFGG